MALATGGFTVSKLTVSQILQLLPKEPKLLKESFFTEQEVGHPLIIGWNKIEFHKEFCRYAGLITSGKPSGDHKLTKLGEIIAQQDPNLSDITTWWFIHTNLALDHETNIYYALFSHLPPQLLSKEELIKEMVAIMSRRKVSEVTVRKDSDAILRWFEESPFANLGTLVTDGRYWGRRDPSPLPSPYAIAYAIILNRLSSSGAVSTRLSPMLKGEGTLGSVFGIREEGLKALLRQAENSLGSKILAITDTAGMDTIYFGNSESWQVAEQYYLKHNSGLSK